MQAPTLSAHSLEHILDELVGVLEIGLENICQYKNARNATTSEKRVIF